ncbi:MAG: HAD-IA family hydrolase, partial [Deltaproteobacteria bacterium]|nr:HAD-IA family hydrolase [Deltaproteobacteria bacterium]
GYTLAVASNSIRSTVEIILDRMAIRQYFDVIFSNEDVAKPKPDPEIYRRCFEAMKLTPEECLVVEDSMPGIQAARQATPNVVIVAGPHEVTLELVLHSLSLFNERVKAAETKLHFAGKEPKNDTIEIVIPMAGLGQRFSAAGYAKPKPLIDIYGKPMIQWVIENIRPSNHECHFTFLCNEKHIAEYHVDDFLRRLAPGCTIVSVPGVTEGAACTLLLAKRQLSTSRPLMIANSDQWIEIDIDDFMDSAMKGSSDGLIMTFKANEKKWSYARVDETGRVVEVAEKNPISQHATVGLYYFKHAEDFVEGAQNMMRKNIRTNGEFYVCPVYNELLAKNKDVRIYEIDRNSMHGLGTPEDMDTFLSWKKAA